MRKACLLLLAAACARGGRWMDEPVRFRSWTPVNPHVSRRPPLEAYDAAAAD